MVPPPSVDLIYKINFSKITLIKIVKYLKLYISGTIPVLPGSEDILTYIFTVYS